MRIYVLKNKNLNKDLIKMTEPELASLCAKGDSLAQRELYNRYAARVNALCLRYLSNLHDAEDLTLEVMAKVLNSIGKYKYLGDGSLYAWISKIATNLAIDKLRRKGRLTIFNMDRLDEDIALPTNEVITDVPIAILRNMINEIPDTQRLVLYMFCLEGYSHKEIAALLGITDKASSSLLSKAKSMLEKKIKDYERKNV